MIGPEQVRSWEWLVAHVAWQYRQRARWTAGEIREELRERGYAPATIELVMKQVAKGTR